MPAEAGTNRDRYTSSCGILGHASTLGPSRSSVDSSGSVCAYPAKRGAEKAELDVRLTNLRRAVRPSVPGVHFRPVIRRLSLLGGARPLRKRAALIIPLLEFSEKISEGRGQRSLNGVLRSEVLPDCVRDAAWHAEWHLAKPDRWPFLEWNRNHAPSNCIVQAIDQAQSPLGESERAVDTCVPGGPEM